MQRLGSRLQSLHFLSANTRLKPGISAVALTATATGKCRKALSTSTAAEPQEKDDINEKIVAAVLFERLPVILPTLDPRLVKFKEFSFQWQHQYRRQYPDDFLQKPTAKEQENKVIEFMPAPRVTEADKSNDRRSLQRALDRRLYLILHGTPYGASKDKPVWHFPEKLYSDEETMRKCAESALESVIGDLSDVYFVGNAPCGHLVVQDQQFANKESSYFKRFFFKSQVIGDQTSYPVTKCDNYLWVTKDELLQYFDTTEQLYLQKMLIQ